MSERLRRDHHGVPSPSSCRVVKDDRTIELRGEAVADALDANNFFSNAASQRKPPFRQNQFGGSFGGPIFLPKIYNGHDRTFFFVDYQGTRRRTISSSQIYDLPSMAITPPSASA